MSRLQHNSRSGSGKLRALPKWAILTFKPDFQAYAVPMFTLIVRQWPEPATCIYSMYCTPCMCYKYCTNSFRSPQKLSSPIWEVLLSCRVCSLVFPLGLSMPMLCSEHPWKPGATVAVSRHQPCLSCSSFSSPLHLTSCPSCPLLETSPEEDTRSVLKRT